MIYLMTREIGNFSKIKDLIMFLNQKFDDKEFKIELLKEIKKINYYYSLIFDHDYVCKYIWRHPKLQNIYEESNFFVDCSDEHIYLDNFYSITESEEFIEYFIEKILKKDEAWLLNYFQYFFNEDNEILFD